MIVKHLKHVIDILFLLVEYKLTYLRNKNTPRVSTSYTLICVNFYFHIFTYRNKR